MLEAEFKIFLDKIEGSILKQGEFDDIKQDYMSDKYDNIITSLGIEALKSIKINSTASVREHGLKTKEFLSRLEFRWYKAFDLLDLLINCSLEMVQDIKMEDGKAVIKDEIINDVLFRLHARSIRISKEIQVLITNGYADGAMARWRSLFEICATVLIINKYGNNLAKRYSDYTNIESYYELVEYQKHCEALGFEKFSSKEVEVIENKKNELEGKYGKKYSEYYGWTCEIFPTGKKDITRIIQDIELDLYKPYYKMACNSVHSGPKSLYFSLSNLYSKSLLLVGPSNIGFVDPAQNTCISLFQITNTIVMRAPNYTRYVLLRSMKILVNEVAETFLKIQKDIESEEKLNTQDK